MTVARRSRRPRLEPLMIGGLLALCGEALAIEAKLARWDAGEENLYPTEDDSDRDVRRLDTLLDGILQTPAATDAERIERARVALAWMRDAEAIDSPRRNDLVRMVLKDFIAAWTEAPEARPGGCLMIPGPPREGRPFSWPRCRTQAGTICGHSADIFREKFRNYRISKEIVCLFRGLLVGAQGLEPWTR